MTEIPRDRLIIGSSNPGKQRELRALLAPLGISLVTPHELLLGLQVREIGENYEANARLKAARYAQASGLHAVADDSGLEVEPLDGAPGLYSSRAAGPGVDDAERREWLLDQLQGKPRPWKARFVCSAAFASPSEMLATAQGHCQGEIASEERGEGGFGYDPLFVVEGTGKTMAELGEDEKNRISHRARAIHALMADLERVLG